MAAQGLHHYSVAVRHEATGELAGLTEFSVDPADPEWGHQELTVVTQANRGHRLGLLIKVAMLEWLAQREPQLTTVITVTPRRTGIWSRSMTRSGTSRSASWTFWTLPAAPVSLAPGWAWAGWAGPGVGWAGGWAGPGVSWAGARVRNAGRAARDQS